MHIKKSGYSDNVNDVSNINEKDENLSIILLASYAEVLWLVTTSTRPTFVWKHALRFLFWKA